MMKRQDGVISLVTTIMVSILLITLSLGLLVLNNGATQQASDDELSLRAYAAASGGIEWGVSQLAANPTLNFSSCADAQDSTKGGDPNLYKFLNGSVGTAQNAITCMLILTQGNKIEDFLTADTSNQVTLDPRSTGDLLTNVKVSWINNSIPGEQGYPAGGYTQYGPVTNDLPPVASNQPPAVELTIINYKTTTSPQPMSIDPNQISVRNVLLLPNTTADTSNPKKILAACPGGTYVCSATVPIDNSLNSTVTDSTIGAIVYIRSMYSAPLQSFHYKLEFFSQANGTNAINVPLTTTTIDVTARSGPVYRRIVAHAPVGKNVVPAGLNYVLFGDRDICKDFSVNVKASGSSINPFCAGQP